MGFVAVISSWPLESRQNPAAWTQWPSSSLQYHSPRLIPAQPCRAHGRSSVASRQLAPTGRSVTLFGEEQSMPVSEWGVLRISAKTGGGELR
jgi:hypothetical protein